MKNLFKKFILLGCSSIAVSNGFASTLNNDRFLADMLDKLEHAKIVGWIPNKIKVKWDFSIGIASSNINNAGSFMINGYADKHFSKDDCDVFVKITEGLDKNNLELNYKNNKMLAEFVMLHELAHCVLYETNLPFVTGDNSVDRIFNRYFSFNFGIKNASAYDILHENFADIYGLILLYKLNQKSHNFWTVLEIIAEKRANDENDGLSNGILVKHAASESLKLFFDEDIVGKISQIKGEPELKRLALQIATEGTLKIINKSGLEKMVFDTSAFFMGVKILSSQNFENFKKQQMFNDKSLVKETAFKLVKYVERMGWIKEGDELDKFNLILSSKSSEVQKKVDDFILSELIKEIIKDELEGNHPRRVLLNELAKHEEKNINERNSVKRIKYTD